jgi:hypothetical protein
MFERVAFWNTKRKQVTGVAIAVTHGTASSFAVSSTSFVVRRDDGEYSVVPVENCTHCKEGAECIASSE